MRIESTLVKALLTIIMLLSLALPGSGWMRVVESLPCASPAGADCMAAKPQHCACCEPGHCPCLKSKDKAPAQPSPSLPPRPVSAGDPVFFVSVSDFTFQGVDPSVLKGRAPSAPEAVFVSRQAVPLYIRHCSPLL